MGNILVQPSSYHPHKELSWRGSPWPPGLGGSLLKNTQRHTLNTEVTNALDKIAQSSNSICRWEDEDRAASCICSRMGYPCEKCLPATLPPCTGDACMVPCRGMLQKLFGSTLDFGISDLLVAASSRLSSACTREVFWGFVSNLPSATKCW